MTDNGKNRFLRRRFAASIIRNRGKLKNNPESTAKTLVKNQIRRRIFVKRLLPFFTSVAIAAIIAILGYFLGNYLVKTAVEIARPFSVSQPKEECKTESGLDEEAKLIASILVGKEAGKIVGDLLVFFDDFEERIFGAQVEQGCRELEVLGAGEWDWPVTHPLNKTSDFGPRFHPIDFVMKKHKGTDYGKPCGSPVLAANSGVVSLVQFNPNAGSAGLAVRIRHDYEETGAVETKYWHLQPNSIIVRVGQTVSAGQLIARVGNTGLSTGCHLHFELNEKSINEEPIDPHKFIADRINLQEQDKAAAKRGED